MEVTAVQTSSKVPETLNNESNTFEQTKLIANELAASEGWYLPAVFTQGQINFILRAYSIPNTSKHIDEIFKLFIDKSQAVESIEYCLINENPTRVRFIKDAIWAHRQKKYSLSVSSFLQQADGIFYDYSSKNIFRKDGVTKLEDLIKPAKLFDKKMLSYNVVTLISTYYWPLYYFENIQKHNICNGKSGLQRHHILHGNDKEYDTELNSLKALLFLSTLSFILKSADMSKDNINSLT